MRDQIDFGKAPFGERSLKVTFLNWETGEL
jgi:hypothetical protein